MLLQRKNRNASSVILLLSAVFGLAAMSSTRAALIDLTPDNGVNSNGFVLLSDLVSGEVPGIAVGDKHFTGFNYSHLGDMPLANEVKVLGFQDPAGNWGISFHGIFRDDPGGSASDALIRYVVEVAAAQAENGIRISDAHVFLGGVGVGPNSVITVDETFLESNESMSVFSSTLGPGAQQLSDSAFFDPVLRKLHVTKDIFVKADANRTLPARATVIDQSYSQTPEPTAIVLALVGMTIVGCVRRSERSRW